MRGMTETVFDVILVGASVVWYASWSLFLLSIFTRINALTL